MSKNICILTTFLTIITCNYSYAQLYINEVVSSNNTTYSDEFGEFDDWIELYNNNASNVNIGGMFLTDDPSDPTKWMIPDTDPANTTISSQNHFILWADQDVSQGVNHIGFKISSVGETIQLYDTDGITLIDQLFIPSLLTDQSFGRQTDGNANFIIFTNTTPNASNNSGYPVAFKPEISPSGGLKSNNQTITISSATNGATIYYTLDGTEPTTNSIIYNGSFTVGSNTSVRAIAAKAGFEDSNIATEAYIYYNTSLPIITINTDPNHLWDNSTGIYVVGSNGVTGNCMTVPANFNQNWERPATITMIETDGTQVFNVNAGISIAGGCSRIFPQKSLNIACKSAYGSSHFPHQIFPDYEQDKYKRIKLRNGGNEFGTLHMRDVISQSITIDEVDIDQQRARATVVFINGQYWGIMNIRDQISEHFLNEKHKIADKDSVDILEPGYDAYNSRVIEGNGTAYGDLYTYIDNNSMTNQANYNYAKSLIDIDELINYQITQIYGQNTDWPANNLKAWREQLPNAKWRWILFDQDWTYGFTRNKTNPVTQGDHTKDALSYATDPNGSGWPNDEGTSMIIRKLLTNTEFKNEFIQRFATQMNTIFEPSRCQAIADSRYNEVASEKPAHFARWVNDYDDRPNGYQMWKLNPTSWQSEFDYVRNWFPQRPPYMKQHIRDYFSIGGMYTLNIPVTASTNGHVVLNENEYKAPLNYSGEYFDDIPMRIRAIANPGYRFSHWLETGSTNEVHTFTTSSNTIRTPVFVPAQALVINEIHYHPIIGGDEFIEIYNPDSNSKNISGYAFTDGVCFEFPEGSSIAAGEYIVLARYANNYSGNGYQVYGWHKQTKLDNGGEMLTLENPAGVVVDQVLYDDNSPWDDSADGDGFSLALFESNLNNTIAANWAIQLADQITPGAENQFCANLTASVTTINQVSCFGGNNGQALATANGGNGSYTYNWSNGATSISTNTLGAGSHSVVITDNIGCTVTKSFSISEPASALVINNTSSNALCNGSSTGSIQLNVNGGTSPYNYSWSNGSSNQNLNNITAGNYSVIVTDNNGCNNTESVTITQPSAIQLNATSNSVDCFGGQNGSVQLSVSGGNSPYAYSWSNGSSSQNLNNVNAGSYTVNVVDNNGCIKTLNATVNQPSNIQLSNSVSNLNCNADASGSIQVNVSGGIAPYNYSWSNGSSNQNLTALSAGNYSVNVTDANSCLLNESFVISEPSSISISNSSSNILCYGDNDGNVQINVTGGTMPYSYSWSNGTTTQNLNNISGGTYFVDVVDSNGCIETHSAIVNEPAQLVLSAFYVNESIAGANDGVINLAVSGGTSPYSYVWSHGPNYQDVNNLTPGNYSVLVTDANDCTEIYSVTISVGTTPCSMPSNIVASNLQNTSATLSWDVDQNANSFTVEYRIQGMPNWNSFNSNFSFAILNNLNACSTYEVRLKANCPSAQVSSYSNIYSFQTNGCVAPCATISGLFSQNVTVSSAFLVWDIMPNASYTMYYRAVGNASWFSYPTQFPIAILFTLPSCTDFEWYVEVNCTNGQTSNASPIANFTTVGAACKNNASIENTLDTNDIIDNWIAYPNPTTGIINLKTKSINTENISVKLFTLQGQLIQSKSNIQIQEATFDLSDFNTGSFIIQIETKEGISNLPIIKK